jgi:hypothetical protein
MTLQPIRDIVADLTVCPRCNGDKWLRRLVPHPHLPESSGTLTQVTKLCTFCDGKGFIPLQLALWGNDERNPTAKEVQSERDRPLTAKEKRMY